MSQADRKNTDAKELRRTTCPPSIVEPSGTLPRSCRHRPNRRSTRLRTLPAILPPVPRNFCPARILRIRASPVRRCPSRFLDLLHGDDFSVLAKKLLPIRREWRSFFA